MEALYFMLSSILLLGASSLFTIYYLSKKGTI